MAEARAVARQGMVPLGEGQAVAGNHVAETHVVVAGLRTLKPIGKGVGMCMHVCMCVCV